jgi:hypothetical protein
MNAHLQIEHQAPQNISNMFLKKASNVDYVWHQLASDLEPGFPLPDNLRWALEEALHADFSSVRLHSSQLPLYLDAKGLAFGNDIYIVDELLDFSSEQCVALILHELTHVVQQRRQQAIGGENHRICYDEELEREAVETESLAGGVIARASDIRDGGECAMYFPSQPNIYFPVIQLSQGWETEVHFFSLVEEEGQNFYTKVLFRTEEDDLRGFPLIEVSGDHSPPGFGTKGTAIPEIVTRPIMTGNVANTDDYLQLKRDTLAICSLAREFILDRAAAAATTSTIGEFVRFFNENKQGDVRRLMCVWVEGTDTHINNRIEIDVDESNYRLTDPNACGEFYYTQCTGSVELGRIANPAYLGVLQAMHDPALRGTETGPLQCFDEAVNGAIDIVDNSRFFRIDDEFPNNSLKGLLALVINYINCLHYTIPQIGTGGGLGYKNKFGLLPKQTLRQVVTKCLPKAVQSALIDVIEDVDVRNNFYVEIARKANIDRDNLDTLYQTGAFSPSARAICSSTFEGNFVNRVSKPENFKYVRDTSLDGDKNLDCSAVKKLIKLQRNVTDPDVLRWSHAFTEKYLVRGVVLECRNHPDCRSDSDAALANALDVMVGQFDQLYPAN